MAASGRRNLPALVPVASQQELVEFHSPTTALSLTPLKTWVGRTNWMVVSLVAGCAAAASLIPVDRVVTAQGRIVSQTPTLVVQPLETAIVRSIDVREGDLVHRGDLLAELDPTFAIADAGALETQARSLQEEVSRLQAESDGTPYTPREDSPNAALQVALYTQHQSERGFKMENYRQRLSSLQAQVQRSMSDLAAYGERAQVARDVESKRRDLERLQVGSQINRLSATDNRIEVERSYENARAQATQGAREQQALEAERDAYQQQWHSQVSQELSEQSRKLSDVVQQLSKARLRRQLVELRATQDATVLTVARVSVGSVLQSGDEFIKLVPANAVLEADVNVAGSDAGFLQPGNPVTVKFDTFPFTQYGTATGTVRVMSPDSFNTDPEQRQRGIQTSPPRDGARFYRVAIRLGEIRLHGVPGGFRVAPGMPVTADIKVGERTVMAYLLGRALPVAMDGMREP